MNGSREKHFKILVPEGSSSLTVALYGGTGDADLYVKEGVRASKTSFDGRSMGSRSEETVLINQPMNCKY